MGWFVLIYTPPTPPSTTCAWYSLLIKYVQTKVLVKKIRARWESGFWHLPRHAKNSPSSFLTASEQKHLEGEIISNSCFQTCFI